MSQDENGIISEGTVLTPEGQVHKYLLQPEAGSSESAGITNLEDAIEDTSAAEQGKLDGIQAAIAAASADNLAKLDELMASMQCQPMPVKGRITNFSQLTA